MVSDIAYKKLLWHSRRGMWELDILLLPFAEKCLPTLGEQDHLLYERLLAEEDQDLFACLVERAVHPDPHLQALVVQIREFAASGVARPH
ncbi:MAG TPA: succinate dehydrogenase assembly factor 2 [Pseudohongiella sp.]|nr:succinate dehydrogenase assembly factor 2 [Pseudohongiella sp.]HBX38279.1 succinate dehydrogenase assembly factor 2 [Pseudohongiella sp.]|tara:strand:- start:406 stop:675 length:270 start_codon:yes stop_codon:yes gene_type:complete